MELLSSNSWSNSLTLEPNLDMPEPRLDLLSINLIRPDYLVLSTTKLPYTYLNCNGVHSRSGLLCSFAFMFSKLGGIF